MEEDHSPLSPTEDSTPPETPSPYYKRARVYLGTVISLFRIKTTNPDSADPKKRRFVRFGFPGLAFLVGLAIFAFQQFYQMVGAPPSWSAALVWLFMAVSLMVIGVWWWDRSAEQHWAIRTISSFLILLIMGGIGWKPIRRQYLIEHQRIVASDTQLSVKSVPSAPQSTKPTDFRGPAKKQDNKHSELNLELGGLTPSGTCEALVSVGRRLELAMVNYDQSMQQTDSARHAQGRRSVPIPEEQKRLERELDQAKQSKSRNQLKLDLLQVFRDARVYRNLAFRDLSETVDDKDYLRELEAGERGSLKGFDAHRMADYLVQLSERLCPPTPH